MNCLQFVPFPSFRPLSYLYCREFSKLSQVSSTSSASTTTSSAFVPKKHTFVDSVRRKLGPSSKSASRLGRSITSSGIPAGRTYREEIYAARRISLGKFQSVGSGLSRLGQLMKEEGILDAIRNHREYTCPSSKKGLERIRRNKQRFNEMVFRTVEEILKVRKKLS